jgi:hypothetical protein
MRRAWQVVGGLAVLAALEWAGVVLWWHVAPVSLALAALQVSEWLGV